MDDLCLKNAKSFPVVSPSPSQASKTTSAQVSHCLSKSFWKTKRPKVSESVSSLTSSPRVQIKNKEGMKSSKWAAWRGRTFKVPLMDLAPSDSSRMDNTLHENYASNPLFKSNTSLSSEDDRYAYADEEDAAAAAGKTCDGFRSRSCRAPGINTRYITDYEASLAGSRCSNSNKLDTPRSITSWKSERSFSPVSDSESFDVRRLRELGEGKDYYAGRSSSTQKYGEVWATSLVLPCLEYQKGQTTPSQSSGTCNLSSTTTGTPVSMAVTEKYSPMDKISLCKCSSLTSELTAGHGNRKNDQLIRQSPVEYLYERAVETPKLLKSVSLPIRNSSKIKTVDVPKPERKKLEFCTLEEIIQRINHPFWSDGRTKRILFICYRAFCTRSQLLAALEKFYDDPKLPPDFHLWDDSKQPNAIAEAKRLMRIKLLNLIRYWLRLFFYDFDNDDLQHFQQWTSRILATGDDTTSKCVKSILREMSLIRSGKRHRIASKIFQCDYPYTLYQEQKTPDTIFDVRSEEIARQMCLMDHEIFSSIRPHEFLGQSWKKKNCKVEAPNIFRLIEHFNRVSSWCQAMILSERSLRRRANVLGRLLKICFYLDRFENLNSFCAIMSGIRANPIFRLKKTFSSLKPKHAKMLGKFVEMLKTDRNHKNLRKRMAVLVEPGIPHIGLLLQDILSIDTGNDNSKEGKINFSKYTLLYDRIEWCLQFQGYPFHFRRLERVQEELRRCYYNLPGDFLYNLSLLLEPRED